MRQLPPNEVRLLELVKLLDIPDSYYDKAVGRYQSLGEWFERPESTIRGFAPKVSPQGSFRLGTVIRPLAQNEEYDIDLVCQLPLLDKASISQRALKHLVGNEVKSYAVANGIKAPVKEGKRAWRLDYADEVSFHIDILASIPEDGATIKRIVATGVAEELAANAIALTCTTDPNYDYISNNWPTSNPIGYGTWFEGRMAAVAKARREQLFAKGLYASIDDVPTYRLKTPLQRSIQLLKRHRDIMFQDAQDLKPISMLITTLAAQAYAGDSDLYTSLSGILDKMPHLVRRQSPRVPNPTNLGEDFANKWSEDSRLEENFKAWHDQATRDVRSILSEPSPRRLGHLYEKGFSVRMNAKTLEEMTGTASSSALGVATSAGIVTVPRSPIRIPRSSPAPWGDD